MQVLILFLLPAIASAVTFCSDKPDGAYGIGCRSYTRCTNHVATVIDCNKVQEHYVFNKKMQKCDNPKRVPAPCGVYKDCSGKKDKSYPDMDLKCRSYYTCFNGVFFGHNPCPGGLVFDDEMQNCNYKVSVKKPCGTKN